MKSPIIKILTLIFLAWISAQSAIAQSAIAQPALSIHQNQLWRAMIQQWLIVKYTSPDLIHQKITLQSPAIRADLSMQDLIDQVNQIIGDQLSIPDPIANFDQWYSKLNELAAANPQLKNKLDQTLILQEYNSDGIALTDGIGMLQLDRIHKIEKYNQIALDPEGSGILEKLNSKNLVTVTSLDQLTHKDIKHAKREQYQNYYDEMIRLENIDHQKYGGDTRFKPLLSVPDRIGNPMSVSMEWDAKVSMKQDPRRRADERYFKQIFNALEKLPEKHAFIEAIDREMDPKLPRTKDGVVVLTPSFIQEFEPKLTVIIKDLTWLKQLSQQDDETLFLFRKWLKHHPVDEQLQTYNQSHGTNLKLDWLNSKGLPHREAVIESYETLRTIYNGDEPWQDEIDTIMRNRHGREVVIGHTLVGGIIHRVCNFMKNAVKIENLAGMAAGGGTFILSGANLGLAMAAESVTHDVIANRKYDHKPRELLTQIPMDVLTSALTQTAFQPGKLFNVISLGAGGGLAQGIVTKQDPLKSALVGATLETGLELVPADIRNPIISGYSGGTLAKNALIEVFTTSAKATLRGGIVAFLDKQDVVKGMEKGAIYGASTATLRIAFLGIQYDPLYGHSMSEIQSNIDEENLYDNTHGAAGGNYHITVNTIKDTPYRAHGMLPKMISASITLPGNVSMYPTNLDYIGVVVHESHHLSQQEQLGLLRFYAMYLYESLTVPYEKLTFEISAH